MQRRWFPSDLIGMSIVLASIMIIVLRVPLGMAQTPSPQPSVTEIAPKYHLIEDSQANMVVYASEEASVVIGIQKPSLVKAARGLLRELKAGPVRYSLALEDEVSASYGDGGWAAEGATTVAHELFYLRLRAAQAAKGDSQERITYTPLLSFSQVIQLRLPKQEIHFIHEQRGYTDADVVVHFEDEGLLYLGNTLTFDGYPTIDVTRHGSIHGMITQMNVFANNFSTNPGKVEPIVPGRGRVGTLKDLIEYRDMLVAVRDRVQRLIHKGSSLDEVLAANVTAEFDARWGNGPVSARQFITMIFKSPP